MTVREIVLDTETTGIRVDDRHKIIEIGCVELIDYRYTGNNYHVFINPEREVDEGAFKVHGISNEFLSDKPLFKDVVSDFIKYVSGARLVIHNAPFDMGFLNAELKYLKRKPLTNEVIDTLPVARKKFPGQKANLDALCKRFSISNAHRTKHGALLDAELLAEVYIKMMGYEQDSFFASDSEEKGNNEELIVAGNIEKIDFPYRKFEISEAEANAHKKMLEKIKENKWG